MPTESEWNQAIEAAARECETRIAEPFGRMAQAFGVGKSDHAEGGDLAGLKALTAEECAGFIRELRREEPA